MTERSAAVPLGEVHRLARPEGLERRYQEDALRLFLSNWRSALLSILLVTGGVIFIGRAHAEARVVLGWGSLVVANGLFQVIVCVVLERADAARRQEVVQRWLPWLLVDLGINGALWGITPLLLATYPLAPSPSESVMIGAALLNALLLYCINNTPCPLSMLLTADAPIVATALLGLSVGVLPFVFNASYIVLVAFIVFQGLKLHATNKAVALQRYAAEQLAADLTVQQGRVLELERERVLLRERERLTREMHDGLGSALVTSLMAIERGESTPSEVGVMLRHCIDDLRSVINSLEPVEGDVVAVLATLRQRLDTRLRAAGLELHWAVEDVPRLAWLVPGDTLNIMRIVQEALTNVLKHAGARRIRVGTRAHAGEVEVRIEDDGVGLPPDAPPGRGLGIIRRRAAELGGRALVRPNDPQGTCVSVFLPIERPDR